MRRDKKTSRRKKTAKMGYEGEMRLVIAERIDAVEEENKEDKEEGEEKKGKTKRRETKRRGEKVKEEKTKREKRGTAGGMLEEL